MDNKGIITRFLFDKRDMKLSIYLNEETYFLPSLNVIYLQIL